MEKQLMQVLKRLDIYSNPIPISRLEEEVLYDCKKSRKGLTASDVQMQGLNIYEKRDVKISDVIGYGLKDGYIKGQNLKNVPHVMITETGRDKLLVIYTNNYCSDYRAYEANLNQVMIDHREPILNPMQTAALYARGFTVQKAADIYLRKSRVREETDAYHRYLLEHLGYKEVDEFTIFHLIPKLFVPAELIHEKVTLEIEGLNVPKNLNVTKPYPNKRYFVAGVKNKSEITAGGFYPVVCPRNEFPDTLSFTLKWSIGEIMKVNHHFQIDFNFDDGIGNFFSSEQYLTRSNDLDGFNLTTHVEYDPQLWRERNVMYKYDIKSQTLNLQESAKLSLFPMHLHSSFHGDRYFQKWLEKSGIRDE